MILDKTNHLPEYGALLPHLKVGLEAVQALGPDPKAGRYEFNGGFLLVQEGETRPADDGDFEVHRTYLDVQILLSGSELVVWDSMEHLTRTKEYDAGTDKEMFSGTAGHLFPVSEGMCWAAFPHDAHKACRDAGKRMSYKKIVMKLRKESVK